MGKAQRMLCKFLHSLNPMRSEPGTGMAVLDAEDAAATPPVHAAVRTSRGVPPDLPVLGRLEGHFGRSLGDVRVHTDGASQQAAREIGARAFTLGSHIYFGQGQYRPDTAEGLGLLGHEAAHVVQFQQGLVDTATPRMKEPHGMWFGSDRLERQADQHEARIRRAGVWYPGVHRNPGRFETRFSFPDGHPGRAGAARVATIEREARRRIEHMLASDRELHGNIPMLDVDVEISLADPDEVAAEGWTRAVVAHAREAAKHPSRRRPASPPPRFGLVLRKITLAGQPYSPPRAFVDKWTKVGKEFVTTLDGSKETFDFDDEPHLGRNVKFREGIVQGMHNANYTGAARYYRHKEAPWLDPDLWTRVGGPNSLHFKVKKGVKPSDAVRRIFQPNAMADEKKSKLECLSLTIAVEYVGLLDALGDELFNERYKDVEISQQSDIWRFLSSGEKIETLDDLQPGDWVYFQNHRDYLKKHPEGYWQGENAVYDGRNEKGERVFSGFGAGHKTEKEMLEELAEAFNADPSEFDLKSRQFVKSMKDKKIKAEEVPGVLKDSLIRPRIKATSAPKA